MLPIIGALAPLAGKVFDRIFPDKAEAEKAKLELMKMQMDGTLKEMEAELKITEQLASVDRATSEVNKIDAQSDSFWQKGWRPGFGWASLSIMLSNYIVVKIANLYIGIHNASMEAAAKTNDLLLTVAKTTQDAELIKSLMGQTIVYVPIPGVETIPMGEMWPLIFGILGLGTIRQVDKQGRLASSIKGMVQKFQK